MHWARWGDAVREAGYEPNVKQEKFEEEFFLAKIAEACRHYGKFPTAMELRMFQKTDDKFPNTKSIIRHFGSLKNIPDHLAGWVKANGNYPDLVPILGAHYKIGRSDELERRVKEIWIALPEAAELVHAIRTDDPAGIEAYWHRRFADKRANGEWFKLALADVAAFKRRKYQ